MIKDYEYNQWSRTRRLNSRDYDGSKPIPLDKIESKSTQPSWDTVRPMNSSLITLGAKNRLFSYEDLASKFSQPKFLKRMGFIDRESDYNPKKFSLDDECNMSTKSEVDEPDEREQTATKLKKSTAVADIAAAERLADELEEESEELSSDDEEYHNAAENDAILCIPPERVPSSKRSNRQKLSLYKDDLVIGSKSTVAKVSELAPEEREFLKDENDKAAIPLSTVKLVDDLINQKTGAKLTSIEPKYRNGSFQSRPIRRDSLKFDIPMKKVHRVEKNFVRFSQPVCLCPKLSQETLNSFYSPTMQKYLSTQTNSFLRCQLHGNIKHSRVRDKIILKSLWTSTSN